VQFGAVPDRAFESWRLADAAATRSRIGWSASTSIEDGLRRTIDWYRAEAEAGSL
jgi:nucleoside-diphosphate-sugar epimerase